MCGRYFLAREVSDEALLRILETLEAREEECKRSGDIFPTDAAPALALGRILTMRWGFPRPGADGVKRFVILTREAPAPVRRIHPRMPVLFEGGMRRAWLDAKNPLPDLLRAAVDDVDCAEAQQG